MDTGYLLLSDITGYTAFLTASELEHANDILNSLLETLLERHIPPLQVAKLEGDAIFAYLPDGSLQSDQAILDTVQCLYTNFQLALETMRLNTTCTCQACRNIPNLDLKFFIHHGTYIIHSLGGSIELSGPDVILAHRLLKNTVSTQMGLRAYALFTQAACRKINNSEFDAGLLSHSETYEHLGEIACRLLDLKAFWDVERIRRQPRVAPEEAEFIFHHHLPAQPQVIWDMLTNPQTRVQIFHAMSMNVSERQEGRISPGSTFHCNHGKDVTRQEILSWQPFELITTNDSFEVPLAGICILSNSWHLKAEGEGTELTVCFASLRAKNPGRQKMAGIFWKLTGKKMIAQASNSSLEALLELLEVRN